MIDGYLIFEFTVNLLELVMACAFFCFFLRSRYPLFFHAIPLVMAALLPLLLQQNGVNLFWARMLYFILLQLWVYGLFSDAPAVKISLACVPQFIALIADTLVLFAAVFYPSNLTKIALGGHFRQWENILYLLIELVLYLLLFFRLRPFRRNFNLSVTLRFYSLFALLIIIGIGAWTYLIDLAQASEPPENQILAGVALSLACFLILLVCALLLYSRQKRISEAHLFQLEKARADRLQLQQIETLSNKLRKDKHDIRNREQLMKLWLENGNTASALAFLRQEQLNVPSKKRLL